jgi:mannan endo-1,4-beta-mannosidase
MPPLRPIALALAAVTVALGAPFAQGLPPAAPPPTSHAGFVRAAGTQFVVDGRPFRFVGANASILHGAVRRASAEAALDAIAADGMRVVRVWALGEHPADAAPWARDYAFRIGPDGWVESSFAQLDRVLAAARARGLRVIVVLANRWADYGGAPRYLTWSGVTLPPGVALPDAALARFFTDPTAMDLYRQHVARVVQRVNTVTGVAYRDDPTVFAWELINESDVARRGRDGLVAWTRDMARYVHTLDGGHMVAAGHIGYTRREQRETWLALQRLPEIDYADAHAYPTQYDTVGSPAELDDFIDDHAQLARHVAQKPLVWGELGFTTTTAMHRGHPRRWWFERFLTRAERDGASGVLAWTYSTAADAPREHGVFFDGARAAQTRDVRAVYARFAARWRDGEATVSNPRIDLARGEEPLWNTRRRRVGPGRAGAMATVRDGAVRWSIAPERFAWTESEAAGRWDGYALTQVYARGPSTIAWTLRVTPAARAAMLRATRVRVRLRASSELPGRGEGATAADGSVARVTVDGVVVGEVALIADDGLGAWVEVPSEAREVLEALRVVGAHALRVEVAGENGVCVYGAATGREAVASAVAQPPARVQVAVE